MNNNKSATESVLVSFGLGREMLAGGAARDAQHGSTRRAQRRRGGIAAAPVPAG
jgi:ribosomal protein L4